MLNTLYIKWIGPTSYSVFDSDALFVISKYFLKLYILDIKIQLKLTFSNFLLWISDRKVIQRWRPWIKILLLNKLTSRSYNMGDPSLMVSACMLMHFLTCLNAWITIIYIEQTEFSSIQQIKLANAKLLQSWIFILHPGF